MDQNDQIKNLSLISQIEEVEKLFQNGDYEKSHHQRFLILADLSEKRFFHHLKKYSEECLNQFPHFFSYQLFQLLALKELEQWDEFILKSERLLENYYLNNKKYEDIKHNDTSILEAIEELTPTNEVLITTHVFQIWCRLIKCMEQNLELTSKDYKHMAELMIWKPNEFHFKLAIILLGVRGRNVDCEIVFKLGRQKKLVNYPDLVKHRPWLKEILLKEEKKDLLSSDTTREKNRRLGTAYQYQSKFTGRELSNFEDVRYDELINNIEHENPSLEIYPELVSSFLAIQAYDVALHLIQKAKKSDLNFDLSKKLKSLECLLYMEKDEFYLVLSLIEELRGMGASADELLELDYMEGSIYLKMRQFQKAYDCLKRVSYKNPNYRMIKERLRTIEKN
jgi:hypothetical protein